jgi:hypothetical protein
MFICRECNGVFREPDTKSHRFYVPYGEGYCSQEDLEEICPYCGGTDFTEAQKCEICREYVEELDGNGLCQECAEQGGK